MYRLWDSSFVMLSLSKRMKCGTGGHKMKGFTTSAGYMGWVGGQYILFASENDYWEYLED